jgi:hypothetical protein
MEKKDRRTKSIKKRREGIGERLRKRERSE